MRRMSDEEGEAEAEDRLDRDREDHEPGGCHERLEEGRVGQGLPVVVEPD